MYVYVYVCIYDLVNIRVLVDCTSCLHNFDPMSA